MRRLRYKDEQVKICFDFDGILGIPNAGFPDYVILSKTHLWLVKLLITLGYEVVIATAREDIKPLMVIREIIDGIEIISGKPVSTVYIDDRGLGCPVCVLRIIPLLRAYLGDPRINIGKLITEAKKDGYLILGSDEGKLSFIRDDGSDVVLDYLGQGLSLNEYGKSSFIKEDYEGYIVGEQDGETKLINKSGKSKDIPGAEALIKRWPLLPFDGELYDVEVDRFEVIRDDRYGTGRVPHFHGRGRRRIL